MPIVFSAITPHPPLLIPSIGKENLKKLKKTAKAYKKLEQDLYAAQPDSIIILSPHGKILKDAFHINFYPEYEATFEDFGDHSTKLNFKGDVETMQELRSCVELKKETSIVFSSSPKIDYGASIPLYFLLQHLKNIPIVPINPSGLSLAEHCAFGNFLKRQLHKINKRYAIIASGDLSHCLTKDAPGGYSRKGVIFNKKIIELIKDKDIKGFMELDEKQIEEASICCHKVIATLFCAIEDMNYKLEFLSYEYPFGVGYLTSEMIFT